jgi:hypothetical protein
MYTKNGVDLEIILHQVLSNINDDNRWVLQWIWIHPSYRKRGNLTNNWKVIEEEFGNFFIKQEIFTNMYSFLKKLILNILVFFKYKT